MKRKENKQPKKKKQPKRGTDDYNLQMAKNQLSAHSRDQTNITATSLQNKKKLEKAISAILVGLGIAKVVAEAVSGEAALQLLATIGISAPVALTIGVVCMAALTVVIKLLNDRRSSDPEPISEEDLFEKDNSEKE